MAHYFLSNVPEDLTGPLPGDAEPLHRWCSVPLATIGGETMDRTSAGLMESLWACPECGGVGHLSHGPTVLGRRVAHRVSGQPHMRPPPSDVGEWQTYLDGYFAAGVLQVGIESNGETVRENGAWVVADRVWVRDRRPDNGVTLELRNLLDHGTGAFLPNVRALQQAAPGILIVEGSDGRRARLDTHLGEWESELIQRHRDQH